MNGAIEDGYKWAISEKGASFEVEVVKSIRTRTLMSKCVAATEEQPA